MPLTPFLSITEELELLKCWCWLLSVFIFLDFPNLDNLCKIHFIHKYGFGQTVRVYFVLHSIEYTWQSLARLYIRLSQAASYPTFTFLLQHRHNYSVSNVSVEQCAIWQSGLAKYSRTVHLEILLSISSVPKVPSTLQPRSWLYILRKWIDNSQFIRVLSLWIRWCPWHTVF